MNSCENHDATEAKAQAAKDGVEELVHDQPAGVIYGISVVTCVSYASGQTLCFGVRGEANPKQIRFGELSLRLFDSHME